MFNYSAVIREAIYNLPLRVRETFILHFYQELSYQEIAQQQKISYLIVCDRISEAKSILRNKLRKYFTEDSLKVNKDDSDCVEVELFEKQPTAILILAQIYEEDDLVVDLNTFSY
ncbi:sigma factor-like helix-turn-helix DNA-binding protein [Anabaena azotica]|uniref:sigma factor-like helix-turn-helix DNA-binding protein n=1 Tax=Anabaena azotica TaxID=197653 RepID=UPI0039A56BC0